VKIFLRSSSFSSVTGSCHVCAIVMFVEESRSKKVGERPPPRLKLLPLAVDSALADAWDDNFRRPRASHRGPSFFSLIAFSFRKEWEQTSLLSSPCPLQWHSRIKRARPSQLLVLQKLSSESSAYSHSAVQWEMDINLSHGDGL
jgi:hypothetical protein